jgi:hypothetical protein
MMSSVLGGAGSHLSGRGGCVVVGRSPRAESAVTAGVRAVESAGDEFEGGCGRVEAQKHRGINSSLRRRASGAKSEFVLQLGVFEPRVARQPAAIRAAKQRLYRPRPHPT